VTADSLRDEYTAIRSRVLEPTASRLRELLTSHLAGLPRIDRIQARAKGIDSFLGKASKTTDDGQRKYTEPLVQIQDLIGARVVVYYLTDVEPIASQLLKYLRKIEERELHPENEWEFGYFGLHYVLALPTDAIPAAIRVEEAPRFFELQIKTLFQHAWSEAHHDLGYKPVRELERGYQRRLAYTAAQSWGADQIFQELHHELGATPPDR
jgi:putative GTP pyrophosphokinase